MELKPGYKQTDAGVIPRDWDVKRLGEIGKVVRGGSPRPAGDPKFFGGDFIPWLTVAALTNIPDHQLEVRHTETRLTEEGSKRSRTLQPGTVIIANSGATLGIAKISKIECCANDGVAAIIDQHVGEKAFVCHCINAQTQRLREVVATGNGQPNLNTGLIKQIAIPWPPHTEQAAIAECISDLDKLLRCLEDAVVKKQRLKQAAMQELLTGKRRLPGFKGEWEVKKLGDIAEITMGQSPSSYNYNKQGRGLPLIQGNADIKNRETVPRVFTTQITKRGFNGDILMTVRAPVGEVSRANIDVCLGRGVCAICFRSDFLYHFLVFLEPAWAKHSKGSTFDSVNAADIKAVDVHLPCDSLEQDAIAESLGEMDAELTVLEIRLAKAHAIKQGMLQQLLTGKIRLT